MNQNININDFVNLAPKLLAIPYRIMWYDYDEEADVLYGRF